MKRTLLLLLDKTNKENKIDISVSVDNSSHKESSMENWIEKQVSACSRSEAPSILFLCNS